MFNVYFTQSTLENDCVVKYTLIYIYMWMYYVRVSRTRLISASNLPLNSLLYK